jgi:hypothetical protein
MTTPDFSQLDRFSLKKITAECRLWRLGEIMPNAALIGRHAGEPNKPYHHAQVKAQTINLRRIRGGNIPPNLVSEQRALDRELYPKHVITGCPGVLDKDGKQVECNPENMSAFLRALPDHFFDEVRDFFSNPENFTEDGASIGPEDVQSVAGN